MIDRFEQFYGSVSAIYHSIQKIERQEMAKYGLKGPHAQCLLAMVRHPEGITAARLCEICEKDKAAVSRTIGELENAGMGFGMFLCKTIAKFRGWRYRSKLILTEKGREIASNVKQLVHVAVSQASEGYGPEERQIFVNVLGMIAGNLQTLSTDGIMTEKKG